MSPSVYIRVRVTAAGEKRFNVRYRMLGRRSPLRNGGTFATKKEADARKEFIRMEIAAGRDPAETLALLAAAPPRKTISEWWDAWAASRVDVKPRTVEAHASHRKRLIPIVGKLDPAAVTADVVQETIAKLMGGDDPLGPQSVRQYVGSLAQVLDYAGVDPNPARSKRVRYPKREEEIPVIPTKSDIIATRAFLSNRWQLPLDVLEQSGMRVEEISELAYGDVDEQRSQLRIRSGKSASARRRITVPEWLIEKISDRVPREDRTAERLVFPGFNKQGCANAIRAACKHAGVPAWTPHDLRHRFASIMARRGVPRTDLKAMMGHSRVSQLDVYEHVIPEDDEL